MRPKVLRYCILLQVASTSGSSARSRLRLPRERRRTRLRLAPPAPEDQTAEDDTVLGSSPISQGGYVDDDTLPDLEPPSRHCNGQDQRPRGYIDYIEILSDSSDNTEEGAEVPVSIEPRPTGAQTGESEMYVSTLLLSLQSLFLFGVPVQERDKPESAGDQIAMCMAFVSVTGPVCPCSALCQLCVNGWWTRSSAS